MPPLTLLAATQFTVLMLFAVLSAASAVGLLLGMDIDLESESAPLFTYFADNMFFLGVIALLTPIALIIVRVLQQRPAGTLHSVTGHVRWRWLVICALLGIACAALLLITLAWVTGDADGPLVTVGWADLLAAAALLIVLVPLQAAGEEYLSRGLLLQTLSIYGRWVGVAGSAAIFATLHGFGSWWGLIALFAGGVVWALMVIRTGGLEVAIAAHAATNLLGFLAVAASDGLSVLDTTTATDADLVTASLLLGTDLIYALSVLGTLRLLGRFRPHLLPANRTPPSAVSP